jgi:hypothetical protein
MIQRQYIINRKLNILELGKTLGSISEASRELGIRRIIMISRRPPKRKGE